jgi:hypothetical protein
LIREDGKKIFSLSVENIGTLSQTPDLVLELVDSHGRKVAKLEGGKQRILPACSVACQIDLTKIAPGKYKALALLDHGMALPLICNPPLCKKWKLVQLLQRLFLQRI